MVIYPFILSTKGRGYCDIDEYCVETSDVMYIIHVLLIARYEMANVWDDRLSESFHIKFMYVIY